MTSAIVLAAVLPLALAPIRARVLGPSGRGEFAYFQAALSVHNCRLGDRDPARLLRSYNAGGSATPSEESQNHFVCQRAEPGSRYPFGLDRIRVPVVHRRLVYPHRGARRTVVCHDAAGGRKRPARRQTQADRGLCRVAFSRRICGNIALLALRSLTLWTAITVTLFSELESLPRWNTPPRALDKPHLAPRDMVVLRTFEKASWILAPATLVPILASNIDSLIYGALAPTSQLGLYAVAKIATSILLLGAITLEGYFLQDVFQRGLRKALGRNGLALIGVAAAGAVLGLLLVPLLFGAAYHAAALAFPLSATAGTLGVIYVWFSAHLASRGLQRLSLISAAAVLVTLTAGCFIVTSFASINPEIMIVPLIVAYLAGSLTSLVALRRRRDTSAVNSLIDAE